MISPSGFLPTRREGILFQTAAILILFTGGSYSFYQAVEARASSSFLLFLVLSLVLLAPVPWLIYRLYALIGARYLVDRDGLRLRWGLRSEDIPIIHVDWIYPASDYATLLRDLGRKPGRLPLPWLRWPGALRGVRSVEGLGTIEYVASGTRNLLLIGTANRIYAISPANPTEFAKAFNRIAELGSLSPIPARSVYPVVVVNRLWSDRLARWLVLGGLGLGIILLAWVGLAIPTRASISLGFSPAGATLDPSPSERLLLLPVLNGFAFLIDLLVGIYFFRRADSKFVAYLLWGASSFTALLMMIGVAFILRG